MQHETPAAARRTHLQILAAGVLLGAGAAILAGSAAQPAGQSGGTAPAAAPAGAPAGRTKLTEDQVQAETKAAMEVLNQFVGRWDVTGDALDADGKSVGTFQGSAHYTFVMSENFLQGEMTLVNGNQVLDWVDFFGYSPGLRKYTHVMMTELDKSMVYQHGEWLKDAGAMVFGMAAPLDTPKGTPRNVSLEYGFDGKNIALTLTMQSGTKTPRTVRMLLTPSKQPSAPTGPQGLPTGAGNVRVAYQQGDPAQMRAQMQQAIGQMSAQKQAMAQYINTMNQGWDGQMNQLLDTHMDSTFNDFDREQFRTQQ